MIIYIDECGYTGDDLFDATQPVFAVATHALPDDECSRYVKSFFGSVKASELKHATLQRRATHQAAIIAFLKHVAQSPGLFKCTLAHKRFALTMKVVDFVVEPVAHRQGIDLYRNGFLRNHANLLFHVLQCEGSGTLVELLRRFQDLIRRRRPEDLVRFRQFVNAQALIDVIDEALSTLRGSLAQLEWSDITSLPPRSLDLSFTMTLECLYGWRNAGASELIVTHDRSTNMLSHRREWEAILSPNAPPALVGCGDSAVRFPIGVSNTTFVDSNASVGIQLADVMAGALCRWGRWLLGGRCADDHYGQLLGGVIDDAPEAVIVRTLWPSDEITRTDTPDNVGDSLAYITDRIVSLESE